MKSAEELDREALKFAAFVVGASLDEPGAEAALRHSFAYATRRLNLMVGELASDVRTALQRGLRRS